MVKKNHILHTGILLWWLIIQCQQPTREYKISGETMGTTYHITCITPNPANLKTGIDSLLDVINRSMSTYLPDSRISQFNRGDSGFVLLMDVHFKRVYATAREVYEITGGAFDPTVMPLVNYWGFGYEPKPATRDTQAVDSLLQYVGMQWVRASGDSLVKLRQGVELDFSAIAKGYAVDAVSRYLLERGIPNHMVEIGGEVSAHGTNATGKPWRIGIEEPLEGNQAHSSIIAIVSLADKAMATSGNYRRFYIENGKKYAHTINPFTGFPELSDLLSVSVIAGECTFADALATAFMVMGTGKTMDFASKHPEIDVFCIYDKGNGEWGISMTPGMENIITRVEPKQKPE